MHYYQFNIADYRKDTTHLSMLEHGAYRQLLDWHYLDQAPIPLETEVVFRRLSARTNDERLAIEMVLKEMFERTESGYIQRRVMQEIEAYQAKADRARDNGKLGGRPKKTKVVISGNQEETQEKANSLTNKPKNLFNRDKKTLLTLNEYIELCREENRKPIPDDDSIFSYADKAGIPVEFLHLAWLVFKDNFSASEKKYKSWSQTFANYVKNDWLKVWYFKDGECLLTTLGIARQNMMKKAA